MEAALKKTQIAHKYMCFIYTLKAFFKDEFKSGQSAYLIPFDHIVFTKRNIFPYIREDCGFVCPKETPWPSSIFKLCGNAVEIDLLGGGGKKGIL